MDEADGALVTKTIPGALEPGDIYDLVIQYVLLFWSLPRVLSLLRLMRYGSQTQPVALPRVEASVLVGHAQCCGYRTSLSVSPSRCIADEVSFLAPLIRVALQLVLSTSVLHATCGAPRRDNAVG